ncbi:thioesterase family protein [Planctomonas sp. JC2975]|uniref:thioesterase family protein n=1 Tax=Planctomonas sp. JC2975 TaxID=2729626 RepID=UPI001475471A|nr:thioesterase family protein [Planctomonas sp. JC2975]NNC12732.1 thioesterase family protein [Planctomonas sp. JC2975]
MPAERPAEPSAYFERTGASAFRATLAVQGAWNIDEQHVAPALGLIAHVIEQEHASRRPDRMLLARVSYDILGVLPIEEVEIEVRMLRPGRTIELVEAVLSHDARPAIIARAWWMQRSDTTSVAGSGIPSLAPRETFEPWSASADWPGGFVDTVETLRRQVEPGRASFWLRPRIPLLEGEPISPVARLLGVIDIANGMTVRMPPTQVAFPNLDLTAHLFREPAGQWIGGDTSVSFGPDGAGLTHTVLFDESGPLGASSQSLTVRP